MTFFAKLVLALMLSSTLTSSKGIDYFWKKKKLIELEELLVSGSTLTLTDKEKQANQILMSYKHKEYDAGAADPSKNLLLHHFFTSIPQVEQSPVFNLIKLFPKGTSLHAHEVVMVSAEFVFNLTYSDNLYSCTLNSRLKFKFYKASSEAPHPDDTCDWALVSERRSTDPTYDDFIRQQLTMVVPNPYEVYPDKGVAWKVFGQIVDTVLPLITYRPIWKQFMYQSLKELYDENVFYSEFRTGLPNLYDLDGTVYGPIDCAGVILDTVREFVREHPGFLGARIIYGVVRNVDNATAESYVTTALELKKQFPDFFAGFDLVGWEDRGKPLEAFLSQLENLKKHGVNFFFHAGQTNLYGTSVDHNLFDALMLGTQRIGGGQACIKHPEILKWIKVKNIGVEISPISSQVFKVVEDFTYHPGNYLISNDYPVVIINDDPGVMGTRGISYDWYITFMGMTRRDTDIKVLKKLALNSIDQSAMTRKEKLIATKEWLKRFTVFCETVVAMNAVAGR